MTEIINGRKDQNTTDPFPDLRSWAENRLKQEKREAVPSELQGDIPQLVHELQVHQIELEMQNQELRRIQVELEAARTRYFDLYDLAPVGYFTLSEAGLIIEVNLTAATQLGVARSALTKQRFTSFILSEDQDIYYHHRKLLFETGAPQVCELRLIKNNITPFWVRIDATRAEDTEGTSECRVTMADITNRKKMDAVRDFLAKYSGPVQDKGFFALLAQYLAETLGMDFICIDRLEGDGLTARTVAVWCDGKFEDNVSYALKDTPCGQVVGKAVCCFPANVCQFFPRDQVLQDLRADSYVGVTLWSHTHQPIGLIAVIGRRPLANRQLAEDILQLVAMRAAGEVERLDAEEKIQASLREKETMLREIYHRVKNNMQVISSLLNLQSSHLQDENAKEALRNSVDRVQTMAHIHNLLYHSGDMARIDIAGFIGDLTEHLRQSYRLAESSVDINVDTSDVSLTLEQAVPCGLILNELVSNAMKHAFPQGKGGRIDIDMRSKDDHVVLTVRDNGVGFRESVDAAKAKSMGMELVNILVAQIGGTIDMHLDGGTIWTITFPTKNLRAWRNG